MTRPRSDDHLCAHVVWAVKHRRALLPLSGDPALHALLANKAHDVEAELLAFGSADDHVHVLLRFPAKRALAEVIQRLKGSTSRILAQHTPGFAWQDGYWARSCNPDDLTALTNYLATQRARHRDPAAREPWMTDDDP